MRDQITGTANSVTKGSSDIEENIRENMYIGNSNADSYLLTYSEAIIQQDDNDEYTILSITPYGSNESIAFKADDLAEDKARKDLLIQAEAQSMLIRAIHQAEQLHTSLIQIRSMQVKRAASM